MVACGRLRSRLQQAIWHTRALHLHFPPKLVAPIQTGFELLSARSLDSLAIFYHTDKGPWAHNYTRYYKEILGPVRSKPLTLLEIGVFHGGSLRLWRRFLPNATIIGIDLEPPEALDLPGVVTYAGDQSDPEFLADLASRHGPFDLVIDDGSHIGRHIQASFEALFPVVRPNGWYVIEDLATSYEPEFEGGSVGTSGTGVDLIKRLVDRTQQNSGQWDVAAIRLFDEICLIQKR